MADKQHIYEGEGSPIDLGVHAPAGSHYLDSARPEDVWFSMFHDPEGPQTEWIKLQPQWPPLVAEGEFTMDKWEGSWSPVDWLVTSGIFRLGGEGAAFSNVELFIEDGYRCYTSEQPFRVQVVIGTGGEAIITITPMILTSSGAG